MHEDYRRRGIARRLLQGVLAALDAEGVRRVEAFPKRGDDLDAGELWNGPESLLLENGFELLHPDPARPVLVRLRG